MHQLEATLRSCPSLLPMSVWPEYCHLHESDLAPRRTLFTSLSRTMSPNFSHFTNMGRHPSLDIKNLNEEYICSQKCTIWTANFETKGNQHEGVTVTSWKLLPRDAPQTAVNSEETQMHKTAIAVYQIVPTQRLNDLCRQADLQQLWGPMFPGCRPKSVEQPSSWS